MPDTLIVLDVPAALPAEYAASFTVLRLRPLGDAFSLRGPDGATLEHAPQAVLAVILPPASSKTAPLLDGVASWAARQGLESPVIPHSDGLRSVLLRIAAHRARAARRTADVLLQLAELRVAHQALQHSHGALRALLRDQGLAVPLLGFSNLPDPGGARISPTARQVVQPVPADIRTLCALGLHLGTEGAPAAFTLELFAPDNDATVATWDVPSATMPRGWTSFAFETDATCPAGSAAIRLTWRGACPPLSLGRVTLRPDRAAIVDGVRSDRALAMRAFISVPGAPLTVSNPMLPARRLDGEKLTRIDLSLDEYLPLFDTRRLHEHYHFRPVAAVADQRHVLVHPLDHLPTIARIAAICPTSTREVLARVATVNPDAGAIEYGLHVRAREAADTDDPPDAAWLRDLAAGVAWTLVSPDTEALLRLELPEDLPGPADLFLMTRLPPDGSASSCWAHFTAIQLRGHFDAG